MGQGSRSSVEKLPKKRIVFDISKKETNHPNANYKKLYRQLRSRYKVTVNKDELSLECLVHNNLLILGSPRENLTHDEIRALHTFVKDGGSICLLLKGGGDESLGSNINYFLKEYGLKAERDTIVRTVYHKYHHPKHVFVSDGVVHPEIVRRKKEYGHTQTETDRQNDQSEQISRTTADRGFAFVYPNGATIDVKPPAVAILSSGSVSFPANRPVVAAWEAYEDANDTSRGNARGRIMVVGSGDMFGDGWLEKEENSKLCDVFFDFLLHEKSVSFARTEARYDFEERKSIPDIQNLSERVGSCIQENKPLPQDFRKNCHVGLFSFDTNLIPDVVKMYNTLDIKLEPLTLVPPEFECPLPPLRPAVFIPRMRDPSPPALDQFDLDEHFADERIRLAQLTNKCSDEDLSYYLREVGFILGVTVDNREPEAEAKHVLHSVFQKVVQFKMLRVQMYEHQPNIFQT